MSDEWLLAVAAVSLLLATFAAIGTRVLQRFSRHELQEYSRVRGRPIVFERIMDGYDQITLTAEFLQILSMVSLTVSVSIWFAGTELRNAFGVDWHWTLAVGCLTPLVLVTTSLLPWAIVRLWAVPFLFHTWRFWWLAARCGRPLTASVRVVQAVLRRFSSRPQIDVDEEEALEDEIMSIVTAGEREGLLERAARDMIEGVIELDDLTVGEIMTPRSKVDSLNANLEWGELFREMQRTKRSRYPLHDGDLDQLIGTLVVKDLLPHLVSGTIPEKPVRELARKALIVPDARLSDEMLNEFLKSRQHLAMVIDEYESVVGLVTIEDVLEEIVGEIVDESEKSLEQTILIAQPGMAVAMGHVRIDELNDAMQISLPESDEYDTLAGLLISGHDVPASGSTHQWDQVHLTVLEATPRQVLRVKIEIPDRQSPSETAAG